MIMLIQSCVASQTLSCKSVALRDQIALGQLHSIQREQYMHGQRSPRSLKLTLFPMTYSKSGVKTNGALSLFIPYTIIMILNLKQKPLTIIILLLQLGPQTTEVLTYAGMQVALYSTICQTILVYAKKSRPQYNNSYYHCVWVWVQAYARLTMKYFVLPRKWPKSI